MHREEHRYGSLQQRKRVALSVADPTDYIPQSPFEESSEFTRRLTSEEILHLNQRQQLHSPSDRLRLFSFTKRHLKLPFSRSKKQRDKDKPASSPEKEPFKSLTPLKQKRSSPTSGRFSASERHDGNYLCNNYNDSNVVLLWCMCDLFIMLHFSYVYRWKEVPSW